MARRSTNTTGEPSAFTTLFFFMTDVNDQGGRLKVKATDADGTVARPPPCGGGGERPARRKS